MLKLPTVGVEPNAKPGVVEKSVVGGKVGFVADWLPWPNANTPAVDCEEVPDY